MQPQEDQPTVTPSEPAQPYESVGSALRAARLRLGQDLAAIAAVLRIRATFLQAIEDGQFQTLPGAPYAVGFVRTYAEHLGLDGAEMVRRFKSEAAGLERRPSLSFPSPAPEGRVPGTAALLISLLAVTVLFGGWYLYQSGRNSQVAQSVPEVPERLANPPGTAPALPVSGLGDTPRDTGSAAASAGTSPATPGAPAAGGADSPGVPPAAGGPAVTASAVGPAGTTSVGAGAPVTAASGPALPPPPGDPTRALTAPAPSPAVVASPAAAPTTEAEDSPPPEPTPLGAAPPGGSAEPAIPPVPQVAGLPSDGRVFGAQNGDARVVIKARGESWVQIRDAANTPLLTRVLRAGDSYLVPNKAGLVMMTGNAGVLDVFVDGNPTPPLGAVGAVRRNIALDADRLRAGSAGTE